MTIGSLWGAQQIKLLTELWVSGMPAKVIAQKMSVDGCTYTKNAVLGKVFRLGLSRNGKRSKAIQQKGRQKKPKVIRAAKPKLMAISEARPRRPIPRRGDSPVRAPTSSTHVLLTETRDHHCRAIVGYRDGKKELAICCGEDTVWVTNSVSRRRSAWCQHHFNLYTAEPRKR